MITINKEPSLFYPAYEDSFIEFESNLANNVRAEVVVLGLNQRFAAFKNKNGFYLFNLVEFSKYLFNNENFEDDFTKPNNDWLERRRYRILNVQITVFSDNDSEKIIKSYYFFKGLHNSDTSEKERLLIPKINNEYRLTYFEGYPLFLETSEVSNNKNLYFKNDLNNVLSSNYTTLSNNKSVRFYFKEIYKNSSIQNQNLFINLKSKYTNLNFFIDNKFKSKLKITRVEPKCGIYLKWYNRFGGYSFFLFENYYEEEIKTNDLDEFGTNDFRNIYEKKSFQYKSIGKEFETRIKASVKADRYQSEYLKDLFYSPHVQMYSSQSPTTDKNIKLLNTFNDVKIKGDLKINNKKDENEIKITIIKPSQKTITY